MKTGFGYLGGTLFYSNTPIAEFKFSDDILVKLNVLDKTFNNKCFFFRRFGVTENTLTSFLKDRLTPASRHNLRKIYTSVGMTHYCPEHILRYSKARTCDDIFWIEPDNDTTGLADISKDKIHLYI